MVLKTNIWLREAYNLMFISKTFPTSWRLTSQRSCSVSLCLCHGRTCCGLRVFVRGGLILTDSIWYMRECKLLMYVLRTVYFVWQAFWCLKLSIFVWMSLAADALDAVRSRGNVSTSQLARKWRQNDGDKNF